ncbi:hypothetical protein JB92DRAFT_3032750 [Gautieria morchelliformis]|nr:hypothetical protein JB92DRAFT_3032750 [Gautieria morchelliformis]
MQLSILVAFGVVCAQQVVLHPNSPLPPDSAFWVKYISKAVTYKFRDCIPLIDPQTDIAATEGAALQSVTCIIFTDNHCWNAVSSLYVPKGDVAPNIFDVGEPLVQSAECFPNSRA